MLFGYNFELAFKYLTNTNLNVIDLGTGSGCIPITLKKKLPNINIDAVDISKEALALAKENAKLNNVDINFIHGDMLNPLNKKLKINTFLRKTWDSVPIFLTYVI